MKTLYESILDDDDVLFDNVKKQSNNWLLILKHLILNNAPEQDILNLLNSDLVEKDIKPLFKNFNSAYWELQNTNDYGHSTVCTLFGGSMRSVSKSPSLISILPRIREKRLTIIINKPKNLIASIRRNVNEDVLLNFHKIVEEMGGKAFAGAEKSIYYI